MDKCLKFHLPSGSAGMAAGMTRQSIAKKLAELKDTGKIGPYKSKTVRYDYKVWLEKDSDYTVFFLLWEPSNTWHKPELIYEDYTPPDGSWTST